MDLGALGTETSHERTADLDRMPVTELLSVTNDEDRTAVLAVRDARPEIGAAVEAITQSLRRGGRLICIDAGTSGRIGLLDAVARIVVQATGAEPDTAADALRGGRTGVRGSRSPRPTGSTACSSR
ncbi:hypothetical protein ACIHEJ_01095 [Streptomyces sp. NPDC052301]|uniref:hypothetical protein n=1 Tax=Streptomyces sp. NPDC052301 TaxID=3365687 RepID=UPI0037D398F7